MTVDVVLAPNNESELSGLLASVYDPQSESYQTLARPGRVQLAFCPQQYAGSGTHQLSAGKWIGSGTIFVPIPAARKRTQQRGGGGVQDYLRRYRNPEVLTLRTPQQFSCQQSWLPAFVVLSVFRTPCACIRTCVR